MTALVDAAAIMLACIVWPIAAWSLWNFPQWGLYAYVAVLAPAVWFVMRFFDGLS